MSEPVYLIRWFDSETLHGWHKREEIEHALPATTTVGFLVHETESALVLAGSTDPATESFNSVITIPRSAVENMRILCRVKV